MKLWISNLYSFSWQVFFILCFLPLLSSCQLLDKFKILEKEYSEEEFEAIYFSFNDYKNSDKTDLESKLNFKINNLENWRIKIHYRRSGRIRKISSEVYKAIINKPEVFLSKRISLKIESLSKFYDSIYKINYSKFSYNLEGARNYSIAIVEEIIFYSEEDCKTLFSYINQVRKKEYFWDSIDKYKSAIFIENNKLYFVTIQGRTIYSRPPLLISKYLKG